MGVIDTRLRRGTFSGSLCGPHYCVLAAPPNPLCPPVAPQERQALQVSMSPKFVPRQHLLQYAIEAAERGDMSEVNNLLQVGVMRLCHRRDWPFVVSLLIVPCVCMLYVIACLQGMLHDTRNWLGATQVVVYVCCVLFCW